jgi:hypothetical protein
MLLLLAVQPPLKTVVLIDSHLKLITNHLIITTMKLTNFIVFMILITIVNSLLIILCIYDISETLTIDVTTIELYKLKAATIYSNVAQLIFFIFLLYINIDIIYKKYKADKEEKSVEETLKMIREVMNKLKVKTREVTMDDVKDDTSVKDWAESFIKPTGVKSEEELKDKYPLAFEPIGKSTDVDKVTDCDAVDNTGGKIVTSEERRKRVKKVQINNEIEGLIDKK